MPGPSRQPNPPWMKPVTDRLSPTITVLVIVSAVVFAFYAVVRPVRMLIEAHLALGPAAIAGREFWQIATALFVHLDPVSFFFNVLGLWFVGATIERELGRRRFLSLFFISGLAANLAMAGVALAGGRPELYAGCSLSVLALFVAFGRIYDRMRARVLGGLVLEARTLTLILVGFAVVADLARGSLVALAGDVVAIGLGYLLSGGRGAGLQELFVRWRESGAGSKGRRRFQVVDGGRNDERRSPYLN